MISWWPILQFLIPFAFMFGFVVALMLPMMIWMERKVSAYIQDRRGPNRAHVLGIRLFGMIHNVADVLKLLFKEDLEPRAADKILFRLAPFLVMTIALMTMAVVPFGEPIDLRFLGIDKVLHLQIASLNVGILYLFAITSLSVYGIILAGWSSGNKFSFLGALRASSQMVSYELGLGLSVVGILLVAGSTDLAKIVLEQGHNPLTWGIVLSPIGFLIFLVCLFAETNRMPFDLPEGESELVAGFHLEYSSFKFALFFMSEYVNMVVGAAVISTLFLGGWQIPFLSSAVIKAHSQTIFTGMMVVGGVALLLLSFVLIDSIRRPFFKWGDLRDYEPKIFLPLTFLGSGALFWIGLSLVPGLDVAKQHTWFPPAVLLLLQISSFCAKTIFFSFFFIWVRWTLPRFRYDQVMTLGWRYLIPLGVANIFLTFLWSKLWLSFLKG